MAHWREILHRPEYDLIYVDGSHVARDVLLDAVCGFALLRTGGVMMFDDYQWKLLKEEYNCPGLGIDVFRSCFRSHFEVVHLGYQFFCRKVSHAPPAVGPLTSTDAMEGEAATTAITSPDVPGDWMRCFERCTTSNVSCQVLMLGAPNIYRHGLSRIKLWHHDCSVCRNCQWTN